MNPTESSDIKTELQISPTEFYLLKSRKCFKMIEWERSGSFELPIHELISL